LLQDAMHHDPELAEALASVNELLDAMLRFKKNLTIASEVHSRGEQFRRKALILSLHGMAEFILSNSKFFGENLVFSIVNALSALDDLEHGRQSPIFKPVSFMNRHIDPMAMRSIKAYSAWTLDLMEQAGLETKSAACDIEALLSRYIGRIGHQKSRRGATVINWRKTLKSKNAERLSGEIYRERTALFAEMNLDDKVSLRRELLTRLENVIKEFAPRAENNDPT